MHDDILAAAIVRRRDSVLLVHNHWPAGEAWNLPGGRREPGEPLTGTLARELQEETGLELTGSQLAYVFDVHDPPRDFHLLWHVFACEASGEAHAPPGDEFVRAVAWVPVDRLAEYLWPSYCQPLLEYLQGRSQGYYVNLQASWGM